jgi:hypothetical protein
MSKRTSIVKALVQQLNKINGQAPYQVNMFKNCYAKLKFWDEVKDFPSIFVTPTNEIRDYLPGDFKWGFLTLCIRVYCHGEASSEQLEKLLEDVETCIDANNRLVYNTATGHYTTDMLIQSITTDEGLLAPYAVGEIILQVRYEIM